MPDNTPFTPKLSDISAACAAFRAGWSPREHDQRLTDGINQQVRLLAKILRPMAEEAGYLRKSTAQDCAGGAIEPDRDSDIVRGNGSAECAIESFVGYFRINRRPCV